VLAQELRAQQETTVSCCELRTRSTSAALLSRVHAGSDRQSTPHLLRSRMYTSRTIVSSLYLRLKRDEDGERGQHGSGDGGGHPASGRRGRGGAAAAARAGAGVIVTCASATYAVRMQFFTCAVWSRVAAAGVCLSLQKSIHHFV